MSQLLLTIETVSLPFAELPEYADIKPAANLVDPVKVAASLQKRQQEFLENARHHWTTGKIAAIAYHKVDGGETNVIWFSTIPLDESGMEREILQDAFNKLQDLYPKGQEYFEAPTLVVESPQVLRWLRARASLYPDLRPTPLLQLESAPRMVLSELYSGGPATYVNDQALPQMASFYKFTPPPADTARVDDKILWRIDTMRKVLERVLI